MMEYLVQFLAAYGVGIACTLVVEGPKEIIFRVSIIDLAGWIVYLLCSQYFKFDVLLSTYLAGLVISGMSHWFARRYHQPVTIFFIPGFFTLVPGGGMYWTAFYLFNGEMQRGFSELSTTLFTALGIALAVFTVDSIVDILDGHETLKFIRPTLRRYRKQTSVDVSRLSRDDNDTERDTYRFH